MKKRFNLTVTIYNEQELDELAKKNGRLFLRNNINWLIELKNNKFSEQFLKKYADDIDEWAAVCQYQTLSEDFIKSMTKYVNWYIIAVYQKLSEPFIEQYISLLTWENICMGQDLSDKFIRKHANELDWDEMSFKDLSLKIVREFKDKINWLNYCQDTKKIFNNNFFREFANYIDWEELCEEGCIKLNEQTIREFKDYIPWEYVEENQKFSIDIIREFRDKLEWINNPQNMTKKVKKEFEEKCFV